MVFICAMSHIFLFIERKRIWSGNNEIVSYSAQVTHLLLGTNKSHNEEQYVIFLTYCHYFDAIRKENCSLVESTYFL